VRAVMSNMRREGAWVVAAAVRDSVMSEMGSTCARPCSAACEIDVFCRDGLPCRSNLPPDVEALVVRRLG
jgi:hypothetical protein